MSGIAALAIALSAFGADAAVPSMRALPRHIAPLESAATPAPNAMRTVSGPARSVRVGQTVPLGSLPPLPPNTGGRMRVMSATGATIKVSTVSNCNSTLGTIYNVGCNVTWQTVTLPNTGTHTDYFIDAASATATAVAGPYGGGAGSPNAQTLANSGVYVFGSLNNTTNNWDALIYITVGTTNGLTTFADSTDRIAQSTFVAATGNSIYVYAAGLTATDSYVMYAENTSLTGQCTFVAPPASPTPGPGLCNPTNSPGQNAPGGSLNVPWQLTPAVPAGSYSIVLYDLTTHTRLAQRQVTILSSSASTSWTITPAGGNPSPGPAGTSQSIFAFDGTQDQSDKSLTFKATGLSSSDTYTTAISDPTGAVVFSQSGAVGSGTLAQTWNFTQAQSPQDYAGHTYTASLYDATTKTLLTSQAFQILGYNVQSQFTNPVGTALAINTGTATSGIQFTNSGDLFYGTGNGDTIARIQYDTGSQGVYATLDASATSCGTGCQTEVLTDSAGVAWTVVDQQSNSGANSDSTITLTPVSAGNTFAMNASVTIPNVTFTNAPGNHCSSGCTTNVSVLPNDGLTWSNTTQAIAANPLYLTNGFKSTVAATAHVTLYGKTSAGTLVAGQDAHGYAPNATNALLDLNQPFSSGATKDVLAYTVTNTSSAGASPITNMQITLPSAFTVSSFAIDPNSPSTWQVQPCPGGTPPNVVCIQKAGSNTGIAANGGVETMYFDVLPPASSFAYTDLVGTVTVPTNFTIAPDGTATVWGGQSTTVDSTALAGYSVDATKITPLTAPSTVGANTTPSLTFSVQNTPTSSDAMPDDLDAVAIDIPSTYTLTGITTSTTGWTYLGSTAAGSNTRYFFGECAAENSPTNGPVASPPPMSTSLPNCTAATEQVNSLAPGATLTINATMAVGATAVPMTAYAHGSNTDAWSLGRNFTLNVSNLAATAGFVQDGTYGAPSTITTNTTPQIGADSNTTYGNTFVYQIANLSSSSSGQNITSANITIPGKDTSGANGADSAGVAWTLTATPTLSYTGGASGCTITAWSSATSAGANGSIAIGGGSCMIPPGGAVKVTFSAKAPYAPGELYQFPATINGGTAAPEAWFTDSDMKVTLSASLMVTVNPSGPGPGGSNPVPACVGCTYSASSVNMGTVANAASVTGKDIVLVSVYTNAAVNDPWQLFISADNNPANTSGPANELLVEDDATASNQGGTGLNFDQSAAFGVVPTSGTGLLLVDTGSGATARRLPYDVVTSFQVSISGGPTTPETANCTLTFIAK